MCVVRCQEREGREGRGHPLSLPIRGSPLPPFPSPRCPPSPSPFLSSLDYLTVCMRADLPSSSSSTLPIPFPFASLFTSSLAPPPPAPSPPLPVLLPLLSPNAFVGSNAGVVGEVDDPGEEASFPMDSRRVFSLERKVEEGEAKLDAEREGGRRPPEVGEVAVGGRVSVRVVIVGEDRGGVGLVGSV